MKRSRFSEQQIQLYVKAMENGARARELARQLGVSVSTLYHWRDRYGGREVEEIERYRQSLVENRQLKQMVAELTLELSMVKAVLAKKN